MHPEIFTIGSFSLHSYGLMAAIGFLLACWILNLNRDRAGLNSDQASTLLILAMLSGVIGSRVFYVAQNFGYYREHLSRIVRIDQGGLVFYGGFILAILVLWGYCAKKKLDFMRVLDIFTPAMAVAHACGRIGCFLNGCCYGSPTGCALGVRYPAGSQPDLAYPGVKLHPSQLYEAGFLLLAFVLFFYLARRAKRGVAFACYILCYGVFRFGIEFLRGDNPRLWLGMTPAQLIGLLLIPLGGGLLIYFARYARKA